MKKSIALLFVFVISFCSFTLQAGSTELPDSLNTEASAVVKKAINKVMTYPILQNKKMQGTVEVSFKIDQNGEVDIVHIESTNPELIEYVVKKLSQIKLKESATTGKTIRYKFVFKKQA